MSSPGADHTVWVSTAGTGTAFGIIQSARERWGAGVRIIAADMAPAHLVAASTLADEYVTMPAISDPTFGERLLGELARVGADTYVPIFDAEIVAAAELIAGGRWPAGVAALVPELAAARVCLDKLETARWLAAEGLGAPRTELAASATWRDGGLVAKPRRGIGSVGFRAIDGPEDLARLARAEPDYVVQEMLSRPEITIDAFRAADGAFFRCACRERVEVKAGVCTKARVHDDPELLALARAIADRLPLRGTFCVQVMRDAAGAWRVTDINARPGAGTRLSAAVGLDFLCATLVDAWGGDARPLLPPLGRERWVVRAYVEYVMR